MTESIFIKKINVLFKNLIDNYWDGDEINGDVKAIELLCHNFLEIKKIKDKEDNKT